MMETSNLQFQIENNPIPFNLGIPAVDINSGTSHTPAPDRRRSDVCSLARVATGVPACCAMDWPLELTIWNLESWRISGLLCSTGNLEILRISEMVGWLGFLIPRFQDCVCSFLWIEEVGRSDVSVWDSPWLGPRTRIGPNQVGSFVEHLGEGLESTLACRAISLGHFRPTFSSCEQNLRLSKGRDLIYRGFAQQLHGGCFEVQAFLWAHEPMGAQELWPDRTSKEDTCL